jgi:hypothetical protein
MPDVGFDFEPPKKSDIEGWKEAEARIRETLDYELRNSKVVNIKSRRARTRFIREMDAKRGVRYVLPDMSPRRGRKKKEKEGRK